MENWSLTSDWREQIPPSRVSPASGEGLGSIGCSIGSAGSGRPRHLCRLCKTQRKALVSSRGLWTWIEGSSSFVGLSLAFYVSSTLLHSLWRFFNTAHNRIPRISFISRILSFRISLPASRFARCWATFPHHHPFSNLDGGVPLAKVGKPPATHKTPEAIIVSATPAPKTRRLLTLTLELVAGPCPELHLRQPTLGEAQHCRRYGPYIRLRSPVSHNFASLSLTARAVKSESESPPSPRGAHPELSCEIAIFQTATWETCRGLKT